MSAYKSRDDYLKLYETLRDAELQGKLISRREIAEKAGYKYGTAGVYIRTSLRNVFLFETQKGKYTVRGIANIDSETFAYRMSQKKHDVEESSKSLKTGLRNRCIHAFYLALSLYNNPTLKYRIESFAILIANAWELLLKARIVQTKSEKAIERKDGKSISLLSAVQVVFPDRNDPVRKNIESLNTLRDHAAHLLIPDIQKTLSRLLQASVLNFIKCLHDFGYPNPYANQLPGLLSLVTDIDDLDDSAIGDKYGEITQTRVREFLSKFHSDENEQKSFAFAIPLQYKLVLTKDEREGDLRVAVSKTGDSATLIEVPKDHNRTHPFLSSGIIQKVNELLGEGEKPAVLTRYIFQGILKKEKIKSSPETKYHYLILKPKTSKYSQALIDLIIERHKQNPDYFERCKNIWTAELSAKRKAKNR